MRTGIAIIGALLLCLGTACNRTEGASGKGGNPRTEYTQPTVSAVDPVSCGALLQVCCSTGDGLTCAEGLVCTTEGFCLLPVDESPNKPQPDLGTACGAYAQACCQEVCNEGLVCTLAGLCDLTVTPPDSGSQPDLSEPDDPECSCGEGHGLGLGHCKENHVLNSRGHGNGHCKYDCQ